MRARNFRSGYVALVGRPNVGKSSLMNRILGQKVSIVTAKPQTTRNRILGIKTTENFQVLFLDTPGIHRPGKPLNEIMVKTALSVLEDADLVLFLVEPVSVIGPGERNIIDRLDKLSVPILLIINKIDSVKKTDILPVIEAYRQGMTFQEILPLSALTGEGVQDLEETLYASLPEGPPYFSRESLTDVSERFMIGEIIREQIINQTQKEIPYAVVVVVEGAKKRAGGRLVDVDAVIYAEKESQKGILIGRRGRMLKEIGTAARPEIEELLDSRVFLRLWVKVRKEWRSQLRMLKELGFE